MADSEEIKSIVEGVVAKVFDKRMAELRKDLHRGVGESLGSRVSELQLDVETGISELFSTRSQEVRGQIGKEVSELLSAQTVGLRKDLEHGIGEAVGARANEIRQQIEHSVGELLRVRADDLRKEIDSTLTLLFNQRISTLREEMEKAVSAAADKRTSDLRKEVERTVSEKTDSKLQELRGDAHRIAGEIAAKRAESLRKEVERAVGETSEKRLGELRKDVEKVIGEVAENRVASIKKDVERVVAEAGEQRVEELRADLVNKIAVEIEPARGGSKTQEAPSSALLESSIAKLQESTSQTDILRGLLDGAAHFSSRVALFVIKSENAAGWQARGFDDNNAIKKLSVPSASGLAAKAFEKQGMVSGEAAEFDTKFIAQFGGPKRGKATLIPLVVRDKVPALLYADSGTRSDGESDTPALQLLARSAGLWLELITLRKAAMSSGAAAVETPAPPAEEREQAVAAAAAAAPAASAPAPAPVPAEAEPVKPAIAAGDEEVHKKAKRFARLLVDEIKLYNQKKVNEGREHKDIYHRLKEDIEKSRASYEKRYGNTPAGSSNYFNEEVVRVLADNDFALMGDGFPRS